MFPNLLLYKNYNYIDKSFYSSNIQAHILCTLNRAAIGTSPVDKASNMIEASNRFSPHPPNSVDAYIPPKPEIAASLTISIGK